MKTAEQIAQWVIDNRYPKSEDNKVSDFEMYNQLVEDIRDLRRMSGISGCFIINKEKTPSACDYYKVVYSDGTGGREFFNGNVWICKYNHPVKMWWLFLSKL